MRRRVFSGRQGGRRISAERASSAQATGHPIEVAADKPRTDPGQASLDWTTHAIDRALAWEDRQLASQSHLSLAHYPSPSMPPIPYTKLAGKW